MDDYNQRKSWFGRNWPWAVPLGGCLTLILLFIFGLGAAVFGVSKALTGSKPYEDAVYEASHSKSVIELLGEPIETDGIMNGNISFHNNTGKADISVPLKGPHGKARVYVVGEKQDKKWTYSEMYIIIEGTEAKINLLKE
ncbi:cytochrome c oxidase assembly factor Coa1 family protein [Abyssalbus ytuae]|uniref:Cytochrome c oxidase assembly factor 1 family protein n=1 Tax=Abyssalbus ytuae TaxID=2926907 RepID=A0A9E6ZKG8_9FLAO|nr:cytochrome c oxidase assembly factor Coa1 family protein [Abyssalbus ytuae]UOB16219.1 cytochrome c oxidase assembly factor 1 family protein [Abyssalbus ytuae]